MDQSSSVPGPAVHGRLSVAPMMEWTTPPARYFLRLLAPRVRLYTEMIPSIALWYGASERFLAFDSAEHPVAVQFGGSDPEELAFAARLAREWGYDEINLNVGCPSDRVQAGRFGACLMREPQRVAECVQAMADAADLPVTVKTRIGVDDADSEPFFWTFIEQVAASGCSTFIVHARKAWLSGLSPKENREIPPLDYPRVFRLKADHPDLEVVLNGGLQNLEGVQAALEHVDGVMVGRAAFSEPYSLACWSHAVQGGEEPDRWAAVAGYLPYVEAQRRAGVPMSQLVKVLMGLFNGLPGARAWRRELTEGAQRPGAGPELIEHALSKVRPPVAQAG